MALVINTTARVFNPYFKKKREKKKPHVHSAPLIQFVACEAFKPIHLDFCPLSPFGSEQVGILCVYTA